MTAIKTKSNSQHPKPLCDMLQAYHKQTKDLYKSPAEGAPFCNTPPPLRNWGIQPPNPRQKFFSLSVWREPLPLESALFRSRPIACASIAHAQSLWGPLCLLMRHHPAAAADGPPGYPPRRASLCSPESTASDAAAGGGGRGGGTRPGLGHSASTLSHETSTESAETEQLSIKLGVGPCSAAPVRRPAKSTPAAECTEVTLLMRAREQNEAVRSVRLSITLFQKGSRSLSARASSA